MILKFANTQTRDRFLQAIREERADLHARMKARVVLPHITIANLTPQDTDWLAGRVSRFGKIYRDVKMEFAGASA